ncbi:phage portal protein [Clostridium tertium]
MPIIKDRDLLNEDGSIPIKLLVKCISEHIVIVNTKYKKLDGYYDGRQKILERTLSSESLPNNKIVANHAEYITDMATGYVFGTPVSYSGDGSEELNNIFIEIDEDSHNNELALDLSIFGVGYELLYMNNEEVPYPELAVVSPLNSFVVVDSTVKHKPMFGVTYFPKFDIDNNLKGYDVNVYTEDYITHYFFTNLTSESADIDDPEEHYFNGIPLIEYKNNKKFKGDFEGVITLIDAYNLLQSDRVNDKEQVVDALLAVIGASLGDDTDEKVETAKLLKELKIIELDQGGDAKWLVKNLNETEIEVLKKSLKDDIHEFSKVPCLTDENFVGNASGVAMKYKLLGFEQLGKTKERYFKQGLRQRLKLMSNIENIRAKNIDSSQIDITMKRSLPVDDELAAKIAQETEGFISWETRLKRFDEEIDIDKERKRLDEEKKKNMEDQQKMFGSYDFKNTQQDSKKDNKTTSKDEVDEE